MRYINLQQGAFNEKNNLKILLDLVMAITFALLFNKMVIAGQAFHEIAGLAVGLAFVIHHLFNWRWIKQVTLNIFKKVAVKTRIGYLVDVLLLITMGYILVSGMLISKILFPNLRYGNELFFKITHMSAPYLALMLLGVHLGLHWNWVMGMFKKIFGITKQKVITGYIAKAAVVVVLAFGVYNIYSTDYMAKLTMLGTAFSQNSGSFQEKGVDRSFDKGESPGFENKGPGRGEQARPRHGTNGNSPDFKKGSVAPANINPLSVIFANLSIVAVFTALTYSIERIISRKQSEIRFM